jgi:hypothetical protein
VFAEHNSTPLKAFKKEYTGEKQKGWLSKNLLFFTISKIFIS